MKLFHNFSSIKPKQIQSLGPHGTRDTDRTLLNPRIVCRSEAVVAITDNILAYLEDNSNCVTLVSIARGSNPEPPEILDLPGKYDSLYVINLDDSEDADDIGVVCGLGDVNSKGKKTPSNGYFSFFVTPLADDVVEVSKDLNTTYKLTGVKVYSATKPTSAGVFTLTVTHDGVDIVDGFDLKSLTAATLEDLTLDVADAIIDDGHPLTFVVESDDADLTANTLIILIEAERQ